MLMVLLALLFCLESANGVHVFDVYRLFQLEEGSTAFGSQKVAVNSLATTAAKVGTMSRYIVVIPFKDFNIELIDDLLLQRGAEALLVLLPQNTSVISPDVLAKWRGYEKEILKKEFKGAIYFAFEDEAVTSLYQEIAASSTRPEFTHVIEFLESLLGSQDQYHLIVSGPEPTPIKNIKVTNLEGWVSGAGGINPEGQILPTIAVVAHYDTFAVAPGLAYGADASASGVVALLELARLFNKLYESPKTQGKFNLLFVLTGAGTFKYAGTSNWLETADSRMLDTVDFAICLEALAFGKEGLYFHTSKPAKDESISKVYNNFAKAAQSLSVPLTLVHKKINISDPEIYWEHELFSRKRILSATISNLPEPTSHFSRSSLFDTKSRTQIASIETAIKLVAEALTKHIYGHTEKDLEVFAGSLAVNSHFVDSWLQAISTTPRFAPFIPPGSQLLNGIQAVLEEYTGTVTNRSFTLEADYSFYGETTTQISAYKVKPTAFDIILLGVVSLYLAILYTVMKGPAEAIRSVKGLFAPSEKKKLSKKKEK